MSDLFKKPPTGRLNPARRNPRNTRANRALCKQMCAAAVETVRRMDQRAMRGRSERTE